MLAIIDDVIEKRNTRVEIHKLPTGQRWLLPSYRHHPWSTSAHREAQCQHANCFSDPQGGKGPCDCKAASIKNHMRSYLNSGHDISNAQDMKSAIESNGGVYGVSAILCGPLNIPDPNPFPKWYGISLMNDIQLNSEEMKVWKAYNVGNGKDVPYSNFPLKEGLKCCHLQRLPMFPTLNLHSSKSHHENIKPPKT